MAERNIQHFKASLARETDEARIAVLKRLLAEEEAKLAAQPAGPSRNPKEIDPTP